MDNYPASYEYDPQEKPQIQSSKLNQKPAVGALPPRTPKIKNSPRKPKIDESFNRMLDISAIEPNPPAVRKQQPNTQRGPGPNRQDIFAKIDEESPIKKRMVNDIGLDSDDDFGVNYKYTPANKENNIRQKPNIPRPEKMARNLNFDNNSDDDFGQADMMAQPQHQPYRPRRQAVPQNSDVYSSNLLSKKLTHSQVAP